MADQFENDVEQEQEKEKPTVFSRHAHEILGGGFFAHLFASISILSDGDQTIVFRTILEDMNDNEIFKSYCNIYDIFLLMRTCAAACKDSLEAVGKNRGQILTMPGQKDETIRELRDSIRDLEVVIGLVDELVK